MEASMSEELFQAMTQSIMDGEVEEAVRLAQQSIEQAVEPLDAINKGFVVGLDEVGEQFGCGEMFLPDLVMAAEAMKAAVALLEPELAKRGTVRQVLGKVVIGTVEGDIHDIGKVATFAEKAREVGANIVGVSSLLTTTMVKQRNVVEALDDMGLRPQVKVLVGGAPVTHSWAEEIGADAYSEDAIGAVKVAKELAAS
jgi:methanogenic corrinoid protein MtbC1